MAKATVTDITDELIGYAKQARTTGVNFSAYEADCLLRAAKAIRELRGQIATAHRRLDDLGAPKGDAFGEFTIAGRLDEMESKSCE